MRFVRADSVCVCMRFTCALTVNSAPSDLHFHRSKMGFDWDIFFQIYPQSIGESPPSTSWHFWRGVSDHCFLILAAKTTAPYASTHAERGLSHRCAVTSRTPQAPR